MNALHLIQATVEPQGDRPRVCVIEFPLNPGREPEHEETEQEKESREWHEWDSANAMGKELVAVFKKNHVEATMSQPECDDDVWKIDVHVKTVGPGARVTALVAGIDKLYRTWAGREFHGDRYTEHHLDKTRLLHELTGGSSNYVRATVEPTGWQAEARRVARAAGLRVAMDWDATDAYPAGLHVDGNIRIQTTDYPAGKNLAVLIEVKTNRISVWVNDNPILVRKTDKAPKLFPKVLAALKALKTTRTTDVIKTIDEAVR